jgi:hypothetical protein
MLKPFYNQEAEHGKRNNVERLFKGEAYRPYRLRYTCSNCPYWLR